MELKREATRNEKIEKAFVTYEKYLSQIDWNYTKLKSHTLWKKNFLMAVRIRDLMFQLDKIDSRRRREIYNKYSYRIKEVL